MLYPEQVLLFRGYWIWIRLEIRTFALQKMKDFITVWDLSKNIVEMGLKTYLIRALVTGPGPNPRIETYMDPKSIQNPF